MSGSPRVLHVKIEVEPSTSADDQWIWAVLVNGNPGGQGVKSSRDEADRAAIETLRRWKKDQIDRN